MKLFTWRGRLLAATGIISVALIAFQVAIIQLLSFMQWHHYANMVISIALLGFGAAGTFLSLNRTVLLRYSKTLLPLLMMLSGLCMLLATWLGNTDFARFDSWLLFTDSNQWLALIFNYLLYFLPFFSGALALGIIFTVNVTDISRFYFSNLLGSGIGAFIAVLLARYYFPAVLPSVVALITVAAGIILIRKETPKLVIVFTVGAVALCSFRVVNPAPLIISEYKSVSRTLNLPNSKVEAEKASPYGFVQVVSADALRYAPGLSLSFTGEIPVNKAIFNNGDWYGPLLSWSMQDTFHILDYTTTALPYMMSDIDKVLVLNSGTGMFVSHALSRHVSYIDAVEPHKKLNDLLIHDFAAGNDSLFYHPAAHLHSIEPRTFLSRTGIKYDLIQLPVIGTFGGTSGLYAMREEYILTKEAFAKMMSLLSDDGLVSITTWMDYPYRNPLKLAATIAEVMDEMKIPDHRMHLAAVRSWGTVTFLLKKSPLTESEISGIRKFCDRYFFDPLLLPGLSAEERTRYNGMIDTSFFKFIDEILAGKEKREVFYKEYDFYLRPATDDKPYFSQFLRLKSLPYLSDLFGAQSVPFIELGFIISAFTFVQISIIAIILIMLPLFKSRWKSQKKLWTFLYFSGIGIGYMFLEIVLIQKFILFMGNPVFSASLVIGLMMLGSGAGSLLSSRLPVNQCTLKKILLSVMLLLLLCSVFLSALVGYISEFPAAVRICILAILVIIPAFAMGFPFPAGLKLLSGIEEKNVPWAWGINGCMSVISASLAALLAAEAGFMAVMILSSIAYTISFCSMFLIKS